VLTPRAASLLVSHKCDHVLDQLLHLHITHCVTHTHRGNYAEYFGLNTNVDACVYLMLANEMIHTLNPEVSE
jgi:hypothetical protein